MIGAADIQSSKAIRSVRRLLHVISRRQSLPLLISPSVATLLSGISDHGDLHRLLSIDPFASLEGEVKQDNHSQHSETADKQKASSEPTTRKQNLTRNRETLIQPGSADLHPNQTHQQKEHGPEVETRPANETGKGEHGSVAPDTLRVEQEASAGTTRVKDLLEHYATLLEQQPPAISADPTEVNNKAKGSNSEHIKQTMNALRALQGKTVSTLLPSGPWPQAKSQVTSGNTLRSPDGSTRVPDTHTQSPAESQQAAVTQTGDKQNTSDVLQTLVSTVWNQNDPNQSTTATSPSIAIDGPGPGQLLETSRHVSANSFTGELQQLIEEQKLVPMEPKQASESITDWPAAPLNFSAGLSNEDEIIDTVNRALRDAARRNGVDVP